MVEMVDWSNDDEGKKVWLGYSFSKLGRVRIINCLSKIGIKTPQQFIAKWKNGEVNSAILLSTPNFGKRSMDELISKVIVPNDKSATVRCVELVTAMIRESGLSEEDKAKEIIRHIMESNLKERP